LAGSDRLAQLWRSDSPPKPAGIPCPGSGGRADAASSARSAVVVTRSRRWLDLARRVDSDYLFDSLSADMAGGDICVFDMAVTHCRAPTRPWTMRDSAC
jgi:hypothetical protein